MKKILLLTGSGGFVGKAVMRCAHEFDDLEILLLNRREAPAQIQSAREKYPDSNLALMNLAWPSLQNYSASLGDERASGTEWVMYKDWLSLLVDAAVLANLRFFQVGSGIERYALCNPPAVSEPYVSYAQRKEEAWRLVEEKLPETSWRLRLHFLFGEGEDVRRFVPNAIRASLASDSITLGSPGRRRCWLYVDDAARGLLGAVAQARPENWDICGTVPVSFSSLLAVIGEVTGREVKVGVAEQAVADESCPVAEPTNAAPFMADNIGNLDDLRVRLTEYVRVSGSWPTPEN